MTKAELVSRIVDSFEEPFGTCPFDYEWLDDLTLAEATNYLAEYRTFEDYADLEDDERLPAEVTPELYMETFNCYIRSMRHECRILRLAKYITDNCMVCEYENYYGHEDGSPEIVPTDFLYNEYNLGSHAPFSTPFLLNVAGLITIARNSTKFDLNDEYFWYDREHNALVSTGNPFRDGIISARGFAEFILSPEGHECLEYIVNDIMTDDDVQNTFRAKKEEVIKHEED